MFQWTLYIFYRSVSRFHTERMVREDIPSANRRFQTHGMYTGAWRDNVPRA